MSKSNIEFAEAEKELGDTKVITSAGPEELDAETRKAERKLVRKLDSVIIPFAVLLYLSAYMDRGNLANARLQGLQTQVLENKDTNYSIALSCFFITYILCSIPGTLLAKAVLPSYSIGSGAIIWSIAATCQAATVNPAGLYVCRLFVGIGEALFGQAMALQMSFFYTKSELSKRIGFFISAGTVAGAFSGLIAFGISHIKNAPIAQWRIFFLVEGCPSFVLAIATVLFLPSRPESTKLLNERERELALNRLRRESLAEMGIGIDWLGVKRALTDWKNYVVCVMYCCLNMTLGSVGGFLPTIVKGLGHSDADAQLYTVPPYVVALVTMLLLTSFSDRKQTRGLPTASNYVMGIVGWSILLTVKAAHASKSQYSVRYFGCILIVCAGYIPNPLIIAWQANNTGNQSQRAVALGMLNAVGQCMSIAAAFLFPKKEGPAYHKGCTVNIAFQCLGLILALCMTTYYRWENKRRDRVEGGRPPAGIPLDVVALFDLAPGFRYVP